MSNGNNFYFTTSTTITHWIITPKIALQKKAKEIIIRQILCRRAQTL